MSITRREFGQTSTGQEAKLYSVGNRPDALTVRVTDYGATITQILVPGRDGELRDVVVGFDSAPEYETASGHAGTLVGRCANRTKDAEVLIGGKRYLLGKNEGENNLHSGPDSWHRRLYRVEEADQDALTLNLFSPDQDQGLPGDLDVFVTYAVRGNRLEITYRAEAERDTIVNLTNHSYFNLSGHDRGDISDHLFWINADSYTETDEFNIPTGTLLPVEGTPFDFRTRRTSDPEWSYDLNYAVNQEGFRLAANAYSKESGILMNVYTDLPGVQFYIPERFDSIGKGGCHYPSRCSFCFETQYYPDAVHHPGFLSPILRAGETFESRTVYEFELVRSEL